MREFTSFLEAAVFVGTEMAREAENQQKALTRAALVVEQEAKSLFGEYQEAAGPFAGWAELADSTKEDRARQGFPENEPLLRTGETRDSIDHVVGKDEAAIGSNSDVLVYQELGTERIPPRSTLGIAAVHKGEEVAEILGKGVVMALTGKDVFGGAIDL